MQFIDVDYLSPSAMTSFMTWECFLNYWSFVRGIWWCLPHKEPVIQSFAFLFVKKFS